MSASTVALNTDIVPIVDLSDTSMAPTGTTKRITVGTLAEAIGIVNVKNYGADGDQLDTRLSGAIASLSSAGLIIIPVDSPAQSTSPSNLTGGQVLWDLRNTGSAGLYMYYKGKSGSSQGLRVDWIGSPVDTNNAIAIYGNVENAGNGTNVIAVLGQADNDASAAVGGFNKGQGPGVQGDGSVTDVGIGVLGTSGGQGTAGTPAVAVKGTGNGGFGIGGYFESDGGVPLKAKGAATAINVVIIAESPSTQGTWIEMIPTDTGAHEFSILASGSASAVGNGKFAIYSHDSNTYPVVIDYQAGNSAINIDASSQVNFEKRIYPGTDGGASQTAAGISAGSGVPNNANGSNGDFYLRSDGNVSTNTVIYHKEAGSWVAATTT